MPWNSWPAISRIIALAVALAPASGAATLVRKPYVQDVRNDSAAILWTTLESGEGAAECFTDAHTPVSARSRIREFQPAETGIGFVYYQHQADLFGLSSGAEYQCNVKMDGRELVLPEDACNQEEDVQCETLIRKGVPDATEIPWCKIPVLRQVGLRQFVGGAEGKSVRQSFGAGVKI